MRQGNEQRLLHPRDGDERELIQALSSPSDPTGATSFVVPVVASRLADGHAVELCAWGGSMAPAIWPGARLRVEPLGDEPLSVGDVVLIQRGDAHLTVHRLVARQGGRWISRGDAMAEADPPLDPATVLGRVASVHVGRLRAEPPRWAVRAWDRGWLRLAPRLRALAPGVRTLARRARAVYLSPRLARARRRVQPVRIDALDAARVPAYRQALLRRSLFSGGRAQRVWSERVVDPAAERVTIARAGERVVGWVVVRPLDVNRGLVLDLWVDHVYRGIGIARRLLNEAVRGARYSELVADVVPGGGGEAVFTREGFVRADGGRGGPYVRVRRAARS